MEVFKRVLMGAAVVLCVDGGGSCGGADTI